MAKRGKGVVWPDCIVEERHGLTPWPRLCDVCMRVRCQNFREMFKHWKRDHPEIWLKGQEPRVQISDAFDWMGAWIRNMKEYGMTQAGRHRIVPL
jgi:hypothetical protein